MKGNEWSDPRLSLFTFGDRLSGTQAVSKQEPLWVQREERSPVPAGDRTPVVRVTPQSLLTDLHRLPGEIKTHFQHK